MKCGGRLGCKWCSQYPNKTSAPDDQKYCEYDSNNCFNTNKKSPPFKEENDDTFKDIIVIGSIIISVVVVVVVVLLSWRYKNGRVTKICLELKPKIRLPIPDSVEEDANYVPGSSMTTRKHIQRPQNADTKLETKEKKKPKANRNLQTKVKIEFNRDNR